MITAWSAVSPFGVGQQPFRAGLLAGARPLSVPEGGDWPPSGVSACVVPDFDAASRLGRRGTRSMDRATALAVVAVGGLLKESAGDAAPAGAALVLGTSNGSVRSTMAFTRDSLTQKRPFLVDPARFPNTVMNCAAGQCAIRHELHGPNVTIAGGRATVLLALRYSMRLQAAGRAETVLCGGVEELSPERAWLEYHAEPDGRDEPLGEGCAMFALRPGEQEAGGLAEVLAVESAVAPDENALAESLARCIRRALAHAELAPQAIWAAAPSSARGARGAQERDGVSQALGSSTWCRVPGLVGDTCAASGAFQIAAALHLGQEQPESAGRAVLVSSVDRDGAVGCALLGLRGPEGRS